MNAKTIDKILKAVIILPFCIVMFLHGGSKVVSGVIRFPASEDGERWLSDNGSSLSDDVVHLDFIADDQVPDDAMIYLDRKLMTDGSYVAWTAVDSWQWGDLKDVLPIDYVFEGAISNNWYVYTDFTPGVVVITNGVLNCSWQELFGDRKIDNGTLEGVPLKTKVINVTEKGEVIYEEIID
jgi:hypothetical protein